MPVQQKSPSREMTPTPEFWPERVRRSLAAAYADRRFHEPQDARPRRLSSPLARDDRRSLVGLLSRHELRLRVLVSLAADSASQRRTAAARVNAQLPSPAGLAGVRGRGAAGRVHRPRPLYPVARDVSEVRGRWGALPAWHQATEFRDGPVRSRHVAILVERSRCRCRACGQTFLQPLPDMVDGRRMTVRCCEHVAQIALLRPFTQIVAEIGLDEKSVRQIADERIAKALSEPD
jgi:hypothetical protein